MTATRETREIPPVTPRSWSLSIITTGGFSGMGKGGVSITSTSPCAGAEDAIASAKPENWKAKYSREKYSGMTDQFYYSLTYKADDKIYRTGWQDDSVELLPDDLRSLYKVVWNCR